MRELWDVYDSAGNKIAGRVSVRGKHDLRDYEYHMVVYAWIINDHDQVIISKRQKGKPFEGAWECTGGCAQRGEGSLEAAVREVREELGLTLDPAKGQLFCRYKRNYPRGAKALCDVWVFRQNFDLSQMVLQKEEVSEAKIISSDELRAMLTDGKFSKRYTYLSDLLDTYCAPV